MTKRILIAPNAFKNSLPADAAALAIREGLTESKLDCSCECFPIGDGGDGTAALLIDRLGGARVTAIVRDPLGREINASFGLIDDGRTAVIEMASASGLRLLKQNELNPLHATSAGTGELIKVALNRGVKKIIIAMGGTATVDGGAGILNALGIRFLNASGERLSPLPEHLVHMSKVDMSELDQRILFCEVIILCDVHNLLLGENGSAAMFGPQKGASPEDVQKLEAALAQLARIGLHQTGVDMSAITYGGTAGGAAAGLRAFINAKLENGIAYFLDLTDFDQALDRNDLVITGEGSIDEQTLHGKGPFGVAASAKRKQLPVIGLAGKVPLKKSTALQEYFDVLMTVGHEPSDLHTALHNTADNLIRTACEIGNLLSLSK